MTPLELYQAEVETGDIQPDPDQQRALEHFEQLHKDIHAFENRSWLQRLRTNTTPKGLYLWGGVGTGKTLLMDMFFQSLPEGCARRIHFHRFMQSIHEHKNRIKNQQNPLKIIADKLARKHRVLCLDEFAVTDITDAMLLHGLLAVLFDNDVILVTTSNIQQVDLYKNGLQRDRFIPAIALLQTHTNEIQVDSGNDYRMAYLQDDSIYHSPLDAEAAEALTRCFRKLAGHYEYSKSNIVVSGREVPVVATGSGVVWFEFDVLCTGNRSKMDYIELSKRFHTVIMSNIPILDDNEVDATRRFIELIDELYDRGVNLLLSAAAEPEKLYQGTKLKQPFKRTISRLQEMSSAAFLARPHLP